MRNPFFKSPDSNIERNLLALVYLPNAIKPLIYGGVPVYGPVNRAPVPALLYDAPINGDTLRQASVIASCLSMSIPSCHNRLIGVARF